MSEIQLQSAVIDYLNLKKHFFWRQNTTPVYDVTRKTFRKMGKGALKGVPDIIIITDGGFAVFLELKSKGKYLSKEQKEFKERCDKIGAEYYLIRSVDELKEIGL